ncbi:sugar-binding domain-containing protein [uncultured Bacteroides sp.]|uniref:sugar-binding domain-containing protein n=1 Tax=uncultured Bacteroides sp. TaxID=162156 RepID=UPI002602EE8E|nr:sugar-binding domain-containing protein [uncultured Bacteroides sp.]
MKNTFIAILVALLLSSCGKNLFRINLAGEWTVRLDSTDVGMKEAWFGRCYETPITLPGTTDQAGLGTKCALKPALEKPQLLHLTRAYSYIGAAWYAKEVEIPAEWGGKDVLLNLERVLWDTQVWVEGSRWTGMRKALWLPTDTTSLRI